MSEINNEQETLLAQQGDTSGAEKEKTEAGPADGKNAEQQPQQKPEAQATPEPKKEEPAPLPEKYEFKMPEGVKLDTDVAGKFTPLAKELKLGQDQAQKLVDLYVEGQQHFVKSQEKILDDLRQKWRGEVKADPKHEELLGKAKRALNLADADTAKFLQTTAIGDHPGFLRMLAKVGELMGEDKLIEGAAGGSNREISLAELMYPSKKQ